MKKQLVDDSTREQIIEEVENTFYNARFMNKKVKHEDIEFIVDTFVDFRLKRKDESEIRSIITAYMHEKNYSI
jgi:flagellar biosynthesis protein FliP